MPSLALACRLSAVSRASRRPFSPASLFSSGEQGVWYDPSDLSTLFQDAAGTIPVTAVEQPVGLMLDKSRGLVLGSELVTNGDFSNGTTGWTIGSGWAISSGVANANNAGNMFQYGTIVSGKWYRVSVDVTSYSAGPLYVGTISNLKALPTGTGTKVVYFLSDATSFYLAGINSFTGSIDNISVRELPGNHATQSTTTSRPTLSARYNLLTKTEDFTDAVWGKSSVSLTSGVSDPSGGTTAFTLTATANYGNIAQINFKSGTFLSSIWIRRRTGSGVVEILKADDSQWISVAVTSQWTRFYDERTSTNLIGTGVRLAVSGDAVDIWHPDLRVTNDGVNLPAYQRVNTATDYDYAGFPQADVFDGTDDNEITAAGGGSTTAFFWCSSIRVGKVGAAQTLFSDTGTNTGYRVRINASNQLELAAGNNTTYITATTSDALTLGQRAVLTAWHDGANLNVQINNGTVVQTAFVTATAGTAQITIGKDNNAASSFFMGRLYEKVYLKDTVLSAASIASTKSFCAKKAKVTL